MRQIEAEKGYRSYDWGIPSFRPAENVNVLPVYIMLLTVSGALAVVDGSIKPLLGGIAGIVIGLVYMMGVYPFFKPRLINRDACKFLNTRDIVVELGKQEVVLTEFLSHRGLWEDGDNDYPIRYTDRDGVVHEEMLALISHGNAAWLRLIIPLPENLKKKTR